MSAMDINISATSSAASATEKTDAEGAVIGNYRFERTIGQGTYGKVKLARHIKTGEKVAIKVLEKQNIKNEKQIARIQREIRFLKLLNHPNIVKVHDVMEKPDSIYIVMDYILGGELFDYIVVHRRIREKEARNFFRQTLSAVEYCHENAVIHRDLKPENLLLDERKNVRIIDFGFGNTYKSDSLLDTYCGSPFYASPEMILGTKYEGPEVDMWSLGVILYAMFCGHLPFDDENTKLLYQKITTATYDVPDHVPADCKHLISRMICVDAKKRATMQEIKNHPWVSVGFDGPPSSYLPERKIIAFEAAEERAIVKLKGFGYKINDIEAAFSDLNDPTKIGSRKNPIITTYYLVTEMLARHESKARASGSSSSSSTNLPPTEKTVEPTIKLPAPLVQSPKKVQLSALAEDGHSLSTLSTQRSRSLQDLPSPKSVVEEKTETPVPAMKPPVVETDKTVRPKTPTVVSLRTSPELLALARKSMENLSDGENSMARKRKTMPVSPASPVANATMSMRSRVLTAQNYRHASNDYLNNSTVTNESSTDAFSSTRTSATARVRTTSSGSVQSTGSGNDDAPGSPSSHRSSLRKSLAMNEQSDLYPNRRSTRNSSVSESLRVGAAVRGSTRTRQIRNLSGWFMNVALTSSRTPTDTLQYLFAKLEKMNPFGIKYGWSPEVPFIIEVQVQLIDFNKAIKEFPIEVSSEEDISESAVISPTAEQTFNDTASVRSSRSSMSIERIVAFGKFKTITLDSSEDVANIVGFEIEVCKVGRTDKTGIHFKRTDGTVRNYKAVINRLTPKFKDFQDSQLNK